MASGSGQRNDSDKPREEGLSNTALAQIWAMLAEMVRNMPVQQGPSGPPGTPGEPGLPGLAGGNTARHEQFHGSLMMLAFSGQIFQPATARETSSIKGKNGITNLDLCLKGEAQDWWTNQLSHVTRVGIMADNNGVEEWVKALEKRFREAPSVALEPSEYVTAIATAAKGCGQGDTEFTQVLHAFCGIDSNLRHFGIDEPEERTTIQEFINLLNRKKVNWFNHYAQNEQKENKERRDQCRNIKQDCDRSQERLNQRGNRNQGQYQNSPMYQPIVPCQALNQISQPYGSNNQQQGFDQGFNQGRSYSQGYNLGGAQV
ncbi:hypothetical protein LPUS_01736 [Lasallia pustulata]|uniref:Uncharacterized protein n=1 Tax=Lasallia pustulata TaxID=136370 RepID=A0A1W5CRC1_9LECA|nr:hypothetical protein LPUS_01736 [Lasallia pustulata]